MPRPHHAKVHLPSPLQQVHLTRPLSVAPSNHQPEMGLVRDPAFWKRFSTAVHRAETFDSEKGAKSPSSFNMKNEDQWLVQQHREKRRCRVICVSITLAVIIVVTAAAVCGWYFVNVR
ncbi:hypothetical protein B0O99DRAFT_498474 [Bisporella sp. PMI_857]|nr:hypothetical protein B0O99DRAFT_498474 [Bisporella sp. PMI_857]